MYSIKKLTILLDRDIEKLHSLDQKDKEVGDGLFLAFSTPFIS
jgi:hypothetical protein